jgi:hypothetical protein
MRRSLSLTLRSIVQSTLLEAVVKGAQAVTSFEAETVPECHGWALQLDLGCKPTCIYYIALCCLLLPLTSAVIAANGVQQISAGHEKLRTAVRPHLCSVMFYQASFNQKPNALAVFKLVQGLRHSSACIHIISAAAGPKLGQECAGLLPSSARACWPCLLYMCLSAHSSA